MVLAIFTFSYFFTALMMAKNLLQKSQRLAIISPDLMWSGFKN